MSSHTRTHTPPDGGAAAETARRGYIRHVYCPSVCNTRQRGAWQFCMDIQQWITVQLNCALSYILFIYGPALIKCLHLLEQYRTPVTFQASVNPYLSCLWLTVLSGQTSDKSSVDFVGSILRGHKSSQRGAIWKFNKYSIFNGSLSFLHTTEAV